MSTSLLGRETVRVDARLKVTGTAPYAAEAQAADMAYAVAVTSTIANGAIRAIDTRVAEQASGVLVVITHENADRLTAPSGAFDTAEHAGEALLPLQGRDIHYDGQYIALVVADTLEQAQDAADAVRVEYDSEPPVVDAEHAPDVEMPEGSLSGPVQLSRGDLEAGRSEAAVTLEAEYSTPLQHHIALEPHAATAIWNGDELTIHETTQWVVNSRNVAAKCLGIAADKLHVVSPFVGGGFGSKGFAWYHPILAGMAARRVGRPVKLALARKQVFALTGHRPRTIQRMALGAKPDGTLTFLSHETLTQTSTVDLFVEPAGLVSSLLYAVPNVSIVHRIARVNTGTPTPMRAPGETPGSFALESALDELAIKLDMDPIELRLRNYAEIEPHSGKDWSSKHLRECYRIGAERFGWSARPRTPGTLRDGRVFVGYGMATATYPGYRMPSGARAKILADGSAVVSSASHDIGTGTWTMMALVGADALGLPLDRVRAELGDSLLPFAPVSGGSTTAASVGTAVHLACHEALAKLGLLAFADPGSPLHGLSMAQIRAQDGALVAQADPGRRDSFAEILQRAGIADVSAETFQVYTGTDAARRHGGEDTPPDAEEPFAFQSFGAQFAEVRVDPVLGTLRVSRFLSLHDCGRVINAKTARSQVHGGVVQGIGAALMEETLLDPRRGRIMTSSMADYHVPVNADIPDIEAILLDIPDPHINAIGVRGIGEIAITGVAAAVANAVFNAVGVRVRDLPILPEKVFGT